MFDGVVEFFVKGLKEFLATPIIEIATVKVLGEIVLTDEATVDEAKDDRVHDEGFENFCNIQT